MPIAAPRPTTGGRLPSRRRLCDGDHLRIEIYSPDGEILHLTLAARVTDCIAFEFRLLKLPFILLDASKMRMNERVCTGV